MTHKLKIDSNHFEAVLKGIKTAEMRKNDRNFNVGDTIILREYINGDFTGYRIVCEITHILRGVKYGVTQGFCMISFKIEKFTMKLESKIPDIYMQSKIQCKMVGSNG